MPVDVMTDLFTEAVRAEQKDCVRSGKTGCNRKLQLCIIRIAMEEGNFEAVK